MCNKEENKIIYREATKNDNQALLDLNNKTPMVGQFSLLIDRQPDFFRLLEKRGKYILLVAEKNEEIIATCSITEMKVYVDKEPFTAHYVSDFRVHPNYYRSTIAARFGKFVYQKLESMHPKLMFAAIVMGNKSVMPFLSGRWLFPDVFGESVLNVYQLIPLRSFVFNRNYKISKITKPNIEMFRNSFLDDFAFYTDIYPSSEENTTVIAAYHKGEIVAALALTDTEDYKQEILKGIPKHLTLLSKAINFINRIYPIIHLPRVNDAVKILYIRYLSCKPGHDEALNILISKARGIAYKRKFHFLSFGIHEKSHYNSFFNKIPKFTFRLKLFFSNNNEDNKMKEKIESGCVFWDFTV